MELFYACDKETSFLTLPKEVSQHCIKVLRHRPGDEINVMDGSGNLMLCRILEASPSACRCSILSSIPGFGAHGYTLEMAVCPTKNIARFEWFVEKAVEMGVDRIVPVISSHSERRSVNPERLFKIALSAAKQSLKASIPTIAQSESITEYLNSTRAEGLDMIAYCDTSLDCSSRQNIRSLLDLKADASRPIRVLIGPEGDFSPQELSLALERGWQPVELGGSRLRTETAALCAVSAVYLRFML